LVAFQIHAICHQINDEGIRKTARSLPKSLPELYERILIKIIKAGREDIARKVFRWVAVAKRPLSLDELREAIAVEPGQSVRNPERLVNDIKGVVSWCGDLVCIDEEEQVVQFAHPTVKQFFISKPSCPRSANFHFQESEADHEAGEVCVTYLNFNDFKRQLVRVSHVPPLSGHAILEASLSASLGKGVASSLSKLMSSRKPQGSRDDNILRQFQNIAGVADEEVLRKLQASHSFLAYARKYWLLHTTNFTRNGGKTWLLMNTLLSSGTFALLPWSSREWECMSPNVMQWIVEHDHIGLLELLAGSVTNPPSQKQQIYFLVGSVTTGRLKLFDTAIDRFSYSKRQLSMAMVAAARNGYSDIVERLIVMGVYVNTTPPSDSGRTALQAASEGGYLEIVEILLAAKADVNAKPASNAGRTALQVASEGGHLEVLERLLVSKTDVNAKPASDSGRTALQAASGGGHIEVVERLLAMNACVNAKPANYAGCTALQAASDIGHLEIVERLLAAQVNVNAMPASGDGRTALQAASGGGHIHVVEKLLAARANVNADPSYNNGRTALQAASEGGHLEAVEKLLAAGANVNAKPAVIGGRTALQAASESGHLKVLEKLLAVKADIDAEPAYADGYTSLQAASNAGHLEVVERLLVAQANINAMPASGSGRTALQAASRSGCLEVVERLLAAKADMNANDYTALPAASEGGHVEIVERLLAAGADVDARPVKCSTALQAASRYGHIEAVERLLAAKADTDAEPSNDSCTALRAASENDHLEIVECWSRYG
jgi:ankyrin repeat protein